MVQTLILMRHGKATQGAATGNDADRTLTRAGRRALKATLTQTVQLIDTSVPIHILTSPYARARQTASLLTPLLNTEEARVCPTLATGDIEGFLDEVVQYPDQIVIAVGHNPFIEQLAERLGTVFLPFKKGALASFRLMPPATRGELIWFVQGPPAARWAILYQLEKIVKRSGHKVWKARKEFLKNPDDDQALHKLRISIRTMRSLLSFAAPFLQKRWNTSLQHDLRSLVRQTSRLRDLDILCAQVRKTPPEEADVSSDAAEATISDAEIPATAAGPSLEVICLQMRTEERDRVVAALSGHRLHRAAQRVRQPIKNVMWRKSVERKGLSEDELRTRLATRAVAFQSAQRILDVSDAAATHSLRKKAKCLRYVADKCGMFFEENAEEMIQQMTMIQDELGALCDARASQQIIASINKKTLSSPASHELLMLKKRGEEYLRDAIQNSNSTP